MAARAKKTETPTEVKKAVVSVPTDDFDNPMSSLSDSDHASAFFLVGGNVNQNKVTPRPNIKKRAQYKIFYEMYRQHPTVRAGIEKVAKVAVSNGYKFVPEEGVKEVAPEKVAALRKFFRKSHGSQLLRLLYKDLLIFSESYWLITFLGNGKPDKALRLHPSFMDPIKKGGQLDAWRFGPVTSGGKPTRYELTEVIHFKIDDPNSDIHGLSLLDSLQHTVASDLFAMKFNRKYFENSAHTGIIFVMKESGEMEAKRNREWLEQNYVGPENAHKPLLLEGDVRVEKSVVSAQDMQFIQMRSFNREEILSVLDVPPSKIGLTEDSNRSTSKEQDNTFRQETVAPLQVIVEDEINDTLILEMFGWDDILFKQNESSLRDQLDLMTFFTTGEKYGVFTPDFIRGIFGLEATKGGDKPFIQTSTGIVPLELLDDPEYLAELGRAGSKGSLQPQPQPQDNNMIGPDGQPSGDVTQQ